MRHGLIIRLLDELPPLALDAGTEARREAGL